jgi:ABC-type multidrug transport system permease subunit
MKFAAKTEHPKLAHFPKVSVLIVTCERAFIQTFNHYTFQVAFNLAYFMAYVMTYVMAYVMTYVATNVGRKFTNTFLYP